MKLIKTLLFSFSLILILPLTVLAQETTATPTPTPLVETVDPEDVPQPGTFGDWVLQVGQRVELAFARSDAARVRLEEKFAARLAAQMEKLQSLPDTHPQKAELIQKLQERHEKIIASIEERSLHLGEIRQDILDRLEEHRFQFEARKRLLWKRSTISGQLRQELKEEVKDLREEKQELMDEFRQDIREDKQEFIEENEQLIREQKQQILESQEGLEQRIRAEKIRRLQEIEYLKQSDPDRYQQELERINQEVYEMFKDQIQGAFTQSRPVFEEVPPVNPPSLWERLKTALP